MEDPTLRDAIRATGLPVGDTGEYGFCAHVGFNFERTERKVTRITVATDLPGLHCSLERVRVWSDDDLLWEGPLHSLEGVTYAPKG